jgi:chromosome segregation ATPase
VDELRDRLEQALLRRAARLLDDMADQSGDELTEVLNELDGKIALADSAAGTARVEDAELRQQLANRDAELNRLRASIANLRRELDEARAEAQEHARQRAAEAAAAHEHERRARDLQQRLAEATLRRPNETIFDGHRQRMEQRDARLADLEAATEDRLRELDQLESTAARREVELDLREDEIDRAEQELAAREDRITRREAELAVYVGQVQEALLEKRG